MTDRRYASALALVPLLVGCSGDSTPEINAQGQALYQEYCALCHGQNGEGYAADEANALNNQSFLAIASDEFLHKSIERGRPGTPMSAWGKSHFGPLSTADIGALVEFIRSWQTVPMVHVDSRASTGNAQRGASTYEFQCASCHGAAGESGDYMSLNSPEFLGAVSDGYLRYAIAFGRPGTPMNAYGESLTEQTIEDLVALIRSWEEPTAALPDVPPNQKWDELIQNPDGPDPVFTAERYVAADDIKSALDSGHAIGFLDARAASDYLDEHIAGALSLPFFAAEDYAHELPKNKWLISYCACPHAASGKLMDALLELGFTKVRVLDEGFPFWKERGYPVRAGAEP